MTNAVPREVDSRTMASNTSSAVCESRLPVGSSASAGGLGHEGAREGAALALAARELARLVLEARAEADLLQDLRRAAARLVAVHPADEERHRHVLHRGELGKEVVELVDEAERAVAHPPALGLAHRAEGLALDRHRARRGRIQAAEDVQQRRFAGAGAPHDGNALAGMYVEVHAVQDLHRRGPW